MQPHGVGARMESLMGAHVRGWLDHGRLMAIGLCTYAPHGRFLLCIYRGPRTLGVSSLEADPSCPGPSPSLIQYHLLEADPSCPAAQIRL